MRSDSSIKSKKSSNSNASSNSGAIFNNSRVNSGIASCTALLQAQIQNAKQANLNEKAKQAVS